jgi:hypothetical protein
MDYLGITSFFLLALVCGSSRVKPRFILLADRDIVNRTEFFPETQIENEMYFWNCNPLCEFSPLASVSAASSYSSSPRFSSEVKRKIWL